MTKLFGLADIVSGLMFVAGFYHIDLPRGMMIAFGVYLALKGVVFFMNFFSLIDIAAGVLLISGWIIAIHPFFLIGIAAFLAIKGLASLFTL
ncbi:MAG: hypothetical protein Q7R84_01970 [bacterium]|nr:hypothetical protein [bacterium]